LYKRESNNLDVNKILEETGGKTVLDFNPFSTLDFKFEDCSLKDKTTFIWKQFLDFVQNNRVNQRIEKLVKTELIKKEISSDIQEMGYVIFTLITLII
jgi:hypothetical protein